MSIDTSSSADKPSSTPTALRDDAIKSVLRTNDILAAHAYHRTRGYDEAVVYKVSDRYDLLVERHHVHRVVLDLRRLGLLSEWSGSKLNTVRNALATE